MMRRPSWRPPSAQVDRRGGPRRARRARRVVARAARRSRRARAGTLEPALATATDGAGAELRARLGRLLVTMGRYSEALAVVAAQHAAGATAAPLRAVSLEAAVLALRLPRRRRARAAAAGGARRWLGRRCVDGALVSDGRRAYLAALLAQLAGDEAERARRIPARVRARVRRRRRAHRRRGGAEPGRAAGRAGALRRGAGGQRARGARARPPGRRRRAGDRARQRARTCSSSWTMCRPRAARSSARAAWLPSAGCRWLLAGVSFVEGDVASRGAQPADAVGALPGGGARRSWTAASSTAPRARCCAAAESAAAAGRADDGRPADRRGGRAGAAGIRRRRPRARAGDGRARRRARGRARTRRCSPSPSARSGWRSRRAPASGARRRGGWPCSPRAWPNAPAPRPPRAPRSTLARSIFEEVHMATPEHHRAGLAARSRRSLAVRIGRRRRDDGAAGRARARRRREAAAPAAHQQAPQQRAAPAAAARDDRRHRHRADRRRTRLPAAGGRRRASWRSRSRATSISARWRPPSSSCRARSRTRRPPGGEADRHHRRRRRRALPRGAVGVRSAPALGARGAAGRSRDASRGRSTSTTACARARSIRRTCAWCSTSPSRPRSRSRTRACSAELRRRERQVEALNRRLEVELAARNEELSGIKQELRDNREALAVRYDYRNIVGRTPRMLDLFRLLDRITDTTLPVVIQGESGTGKELVARAIHANGPRRDRPFVGENCAAIPETLLESTLFGYVRGAFTGAEHDTRGLFEVADGGTLFLDEVGEMSPGMQGKLLRVLQEGELRRVGSERTRKVDVRILAATNRDLAPHGRGGEVPPGSVLPPERRADRAAAAARAPRRHPAAGRALPGEAGGGRRPARAETARRRRRWRGSARTAGRATSASWRTRSRAPTRCRAIASASPTCRRRSRPPAIRARSCPTIPTAWC